MRRFSISWPQVILEIVEESGNNTKQRTSAANNTLITLSIGQRNPLVDGIMETLLPNN